MAATFDETSRTAWISQGFERLADRVHKAPDDIHFDVLIIGSGYGGAIAAATLTGRTKDGNSITVAVLERGNEYLPGSFPAGLPELPRHLRRPGNRQGLFDVRPGPEVNTVVANGVGGGSLINAGVMETPLPQQFESNWPSELSNLSTWVDYYDRAAEMLGARPGGNPNTIEDHADGIPTKHEAIEALSPDQFRPAEITVAMDDRTNMAGVKLNKCLRCGDCATGCNYGAKESLDVGLLVKAYRAGAEIFSGATVLHIDEKADHWAVATVYTDANLRARDDNVRFIRARKVIVAAGTLGSNEILMRSHANGLSLSGDRLGKRCSTNGDMLATDFATNALVNNIADQADKPSERAIGPTITGVIDLREEHGVLIEEISVPASLRVVFSEVFGSVSALHGLQDIDWSRHRNGFPADDGYAIPSQSIENTAVYAIMGDDGAAGYIELEDRSKNPRKDGEATLRWNTEANGFHDGFAHGIETLGELTENTGGRLIANPAWRLLPPDLSFLTGGQYGPVTTVHPLGGLVMADSPGDGVVDPLGRVYKSGTPADVYDDLVVMDGSIVPTALGTNPALTIAALALRSSETLADVWSFDAVVAPQPVAKERPVFRDTDHARHPEPTEVEVIERLWGDVRMAPVGGVVGDYVVELTIRFEPKAVPDLNPATGGDCMLTVSGDDTGGLASSRIRVFAKSDWEALERNWNPPVRREQELDAIAKFRAPLTGTLKVLEREESCFGGRVWRAGWAWLLNRGLRDIYQAIFHGESGGQGPGLFSRIKSGIAIASRAGEVRKLVYDLDIGAPLPSSSIELSGSHISGVKRFTYNRCGNPWRQLMEVALEAFPGVAPGKAPVLKLDMAFLARIGVPLFRISKQADGINAIADLLGFFGYFLRILLGIHVWSFRAPDPDLDPVNDDVVFKPPETLTLSDGTVINAEMILDNVPNEKPDMAETDDLVPGKIHITRYPRPESTKRPVVTFHGYSAGGTTFAHHAVTPNFASHLLEAGREVWVSDLRTSPFFADTTATKPWSFEQIAKTDVPHVIRKAAATSPDGKVDVIAHCMGTIVFSMAVLNPENNRNNPLANGTHEIPLRDQIGRAAFIQVGPLVVFSPINILRGYVMRYLLEFLPDNYQFKPDDPDLVDDLLDRVLATLPYPEEEFRIENPLWPCKRTPWTRTRHRMDALYGRDFSAANMEPGVLKFIDEHFGALSLRTVGSTLHYARNDMMTDHHGFNDLVSRENFSNHWIFPTFSVHGGDNGLSDVATVSRMSKILHDSGVEYLQPHVIEGAGHQDVLIGTARQETFDHVTTFLDAELGQNPYRRNTDKVAYPPWIGPIMTIERPPSILPNPLTNANAPGDWANIARIGTAPSHRKAEGVIMLRVHVAGNQILRADTLSDTWDVDHIEASMAVHKSDALAKNRWDAFEIPDPDVMPNNALNVNGNATLVLVIYDEAESLAARMRGAYIMAQNGQLFSFDRQGKMFPDVPDEFTLLDFRDMRDGVVEALARDGAATRGRSDLHAGGLVLKGHRTVPRIVVDPEVETGVRMMNGSEPVFGPEGEAETAIFGSLANEDVHLFDGIVPDRPEPTNGEHTSFAFGSCQYPAGMLDGPVTYRSYEGLASRLTGGLPNAPRLTLFVGDQVYTDPTAGLFDPADKDDRFRIPYENWLRAPGVRTALRSAPSYMLLDDHEIYDNYEPEPHPGNVKQKWLTQGKTAYEKYQHGLRAWGEAFKFDGFDFFMLDTRTERERRWVGAFPAPDLVDPAVLGRLLTWLDSTDRPKFIVSPSMILPRHRRAVQRDNRLDPSNLSALHSDGWDGYPGTMWTVLGHIAEHATRNVVFLSGDEHRASIASADILNEAGQVATTVTSIHTAAMWAPFPFANALDEDIVEGDEFEIATNAQQFTCKVNSWRPVAGDGPTYVRVWTDQGAWKLECEFGSGTVQTLVL